MTTLQIEQTYWRTGKHLIAGMDEVGRGPLAGPVLACAIIFNKNYFLPGIRDSKKLSPRQRAEFAAVLKQNALCWGIGLAGVEEIDQFNIRKATFLAMHRAVSDLTLKPDLVLVDGENLPESSCASLGIIGGDDKSFTIAAASIVAKVERDQMMQELDQQYPIYRFARNKGYGTREHIRILRSNGPCIQHRRTFLKKILSLVPRI